MKHKLDGSVDRYKACLVAKGYSQTFSIDYQESFAAMAKKNLVRVLISVDTNQGWSLLQFDVKNAFLHRDLEEDLYMVISPGFQMSGAKGKMCRLKNAHCGLKQLPRVWFQRF